MSATQIRIKFDKDLIKNTVKSGSKKATWSALDVLASVSKDQVPLDQGPLKNSCYVDVESDGSQGTVSYDTPYAVIQHERLDFRHQRGRKAKYLEDPAHDSSVHSKMNEAAKRAFSSEIK